MKIQILGSGCQKCNDLFNNAQNAIKQKNINCEVEKVTDIETIVNMGVIITPALVIDGKVVCSGKLLSAEEILDLISDATGGECCCCCSGNKPQKEESPCCCSSEKTVEESSCCGSGETETSCCCSGQKSSFLKKVIAALLLVFVFGSILYMIDREKSPAPITNAASGEVAKNALNVYYFHGKNRCFTCNKIEELTRKAVGESENIRFITVNVESKENEHFVEDFQLISRCVVMERNGKFEKFDRVWELVNTPNKFDAYIKDGIARFSK